MKNRIWRQIRRIGIAAAAAGAVLGAGFQPETVKSADLTDVNISIGQIGSWTDRENGKADNQFAPGSMLPKIEAGVSFVEKGNGRRTIITDMAHAKDGYCEKTGTIIK
jgi:hypothetical protein